MEKELPFKLSSVKERLFNPAFRLHEVDVNGCFLVANKTLLDGAKHALAEQHYGMVLWVDTEADVERIVIGFRRI